MSEARHSTIDIIPPRIPAAVGAAGLALTTLLVAGCSNAAPVGECSSPKVERAYPGDPSADPADQSTWVNGFLVRTVMPPDATGLVLYFRGNNDSTWRSSEPIDPDLADEVAMRLGLADVVVAASVVAKTGSPACDEPPDTSFSDIQPFSPLVDAGATLPKW